MNSKTPFSLSGKIVVITGFGTPKDALSNGGAIAQLFAKQGAIIEGLDISAEDAQNTVEAINGAGGQAFFTSGRYSGSRYLQLDKSVLKRHGRIDILIIMLASPKDLPLKMQTQAFGEKLALNLDSAFYCTRAVCRL